MSAAVAAAAAAAAACVSSNNTTSHSHHQSNQQNHRSVSFFPPSPQPAALLAALSRYESQKRRDWNTFVQYLKNHCPTLADLSRCTEAHVLEFLKYLDQFGETKVHTQNCPFFGQPHSPTPCSCPLKEAWGSLDAIIGRLRAAYEEKGGGQPDQMNPFRALAVRMYLREVRDAQAEARGIAYYI